MKELIIYIITLNVILTITFYMYSFIADDVSDFEIIKPRDGIECVVVSRMFNTSVDCYKVNK